MWACVWGYVSKITLKEKRNSYIKAPLQDSYGPLTGMVDLLKPEFETNLALDS